MSERINLGNGTSCVISEVGTKYWYLNDKLYRTDGPAAENVNGNKYWCLNGKLHRTDGPAIECANGNKSWSINGKEYSEEDFEMAKEMLWTV